MNSFKKYWPQIRKGLVNFIGLYATIAFTISMEKAETAHERELLYYDLAYGIRNDFDYTLQYLNDYTDQNEWVKELYITQYKIWEEDNDSIFISTDIDEETNEKWYFPPLAFITNLDPFNPPLTVGQMFDGKDPYFNSVNPHMSKIIQNIVFGTTLDYLKINTDQNERKFVEDWISVERRWALEGLNTADKIYNEFWIENRKFIQKDLEAKYILLNRIELWEQINEQLSYYKEELEESIKEMDSLLAIRETKTTVMYWTF